MVIMFILAGYQFALFIEALRSGATSLPFRPPMIEGFLPIAAIVGFRGWLANGVFDSVHPAGVVILIATLITAVLFRRGLCGWLCPLGAFSEFLGRLGKRIKIRGVTIGARTLPRWVDRPLLALKFLLFIYAFKLFFLMDAEAALAFMKSPYYAISDLKMFELFERLGVVGVGVIGGVILFSVFIKSLWCRYLCPYGALLGVAGLFSPVLLQRDDNSCTKCGKCTKVCPNNVVLDKGRTTIISTECIGCAECIEVCPKKSAGALSFKLFGVVRVRPLIFGMLFLVAFFSVIAFAKSQGHWQTELTPVQYKTYYQIMKR
jgi:polyferredoxin